MKLGGVTQADHRRQAHIEAPHHPPFLGIRLHYLSRPARCRSRRARNPNPTPLLAFNV